MNSSSRDHAPTAGSALERHTPGPWATHPLFPTYVVPADHAERPVGGAADDAEDLRRFAQEIANTELFVRHRSLAEARANACLIAAAPELLSLAKSLERWLLKDAEPFHISTDDMRVYHLDGGVLGNLLDEARAAIAKATGDRT